ncbi:MAG: chromosomal replication initiator protein DnaA [Deltaproteobacteria bacterium]|nr:chromosomal replication initiator protein DnaA [Deltaproteobacteria bacterium]
MWDKLCDKLYKQSGKECSVWISQIIDKRVEGEIFILSVPNSFVQKWIENHYLEKMKKILREMRGEKADIELRVERNKYIERRQEKRKDDLSKKYTFNNFVVGPSNQLAYAASYAVAEHPGKAYNPLFIYSGVGLGKTHLLHAISNAVYNKYKNLNILYISSEEFTNELITSIQNKTMSGFRSKYRSIDLLLIDDIHFISGKERTAEEFFHTFNALYEKQGQIVLTSDNPPALIPDIEDRLKSRFNWGLIVDIQPPEFETRVVIIKRKAQFNNMKISDEVVNLLAEHIDTNVREIEGILVKIGAYSSIMKHPIDLEFARNVLSEEIAYRKQRLSIENIQQAVANKYNITLDNMLSRKRNKEIIKPRKIAIYLIRKLTNHSLSEIKLKFNINSHATIIHAVKNIENLLQKNEIFRQEIEILEKSLSNVSKNKHL